MKHFYLHISKTKYLQGFLCSHTDDNSTTLKNRVSHNIHITDCTTYLFTNSSSGEVQSEAKLRKKGHNNYLQQALKLGIIKVLLRKAGISKTIECFGLSYSPLSSRSPVSNNY